MFAGKQQTPVGVMGMVLLLLLFAPRAHTDSKRDADSNRSDSSAPSSVVRQDVVRLPVEEAKGLTFHRLSTADGLSQTRVSQIIQDDLGFIWFGTQYGINRFDGYKFKLFVHELGNEKSAAGTSVLSLLKDRDGLIWIGWRQGLDRLDPRTEQFTHYLVEPDESTHRANAILHISQDREGMLWLATGSGLHRLDPTTGALAHFRHSADAGSLPTNDVNWSGEDSHGRFWVGTSQGLSEFDRVQGKVLRHLAMPDAVQISLFEDRDGRFWIAQASGNGLALFDPEANTVTPYSFYDRDPGAAALTGIMGIAEDADGNLWLGSPGLGLLRLNRERDRFDRYGYQPQDVHSIAENKVIALFQDRDGNLWTGLHSAGVNYFGRGSQRFELFRNIPGDPNSLTLDFVNAILEDRDGILWIGNDDGLNRIDRRTGQRETIDLALGRKPMVISLAQDHTGAIWIGTFAHGLTRYDPRTRRFETYTHDPSDSRSLSHNWVHCLYVDSKGTVWAATDDGLSRFDPGTRNFSVFRLTSDSRLSQAYTGIDEDASGHLWLGSVYSGLHRLDPASAAVTVYKYKSSDPNGLRDSTLHSVHMSRKGILWIATQNGLNSLDPRTGALRAYDTRDGMPANPVSCILEDDRGDIWLSTTRGISKYSPETGTFSNYSLFVGLRGSDFTGWDACYKGRRGELFFAGFSGAVGFVPTDLQEVVPAAPLVLTDFEIDGFKARIGREQPLERAIAYSERVTLAHTQRNFSITFAGLRYSSPETTRYRYRLEGLDSAWHESPTSIRQATYTTLPAGNYTFQVQMAADRGAWQMPGISLSLFILPPWWATWWFRTLCALLLAALTWSIVRMRVRYVARKITLEMEARNSERMRIAGDLHDTLLQGLLSASLQLSVVQDQISPSAKARPLLEHVSNLLRQLVQEGRNTVRGLRTWHFDSDDLERAIAAIPGDLRIQSAAQFRVTIEGQSRPLLPVARTEVYLIAREAISNALRHSDASAIEANLEYLAESFQITVRDDGRGFDADTVAAGRSNHFGLAVMSERAERFGAVLKVSSGPGVGTEIVLSAAARAIYQPEFTKNSSRPL
ncbi:MAG: two-component regulator propeller domain-containing protein [Steroidobacteraceae bacterium]